MNQAVENHAGQVTQSGDIIVCQGGAACRAASDEAGRQRRFEELTGIACCGEARRALEHLLDSGMLERRQLALAWRAGALHWDWRSGDWGEGRLATRVSRVELAYGMTLVAAGALAFVAFVVLFLTGPRLPPWPALQYLAMATGFALVVPFAERWLIRPNRIARRAAPLLDRYYATATPAPQSRALSRAEAPG